MAQHKLTEDDMRQIAHYVSQRYTSSHTSGGEYLRATEHYLEMYNKVMDKLNSEKSSGFFTRSSKDVFSLSLSTKRDSLDLWRGYGRNSGIAIGFDRQTSTDLVLIRKEDYESVKERHKSDSRKKTLPNSKLFVANNVIYEDDANLENGTERVTQNGQKGCKSITYKILKQNGAKQVIVATVAKSVKVNKKLRRI